MTTPIGAHVREVFEAMGNTMIQFLLIGVGLSVRFTDAFRDDLSIALFMTCILAIFALHAGRVLQEISTKSASHDVVELLEYKLVSTLR